MKVLQCFALIVLCCCGVITALQNAGQLNHTLVPIDVKNEVVVDLVQAFEQFFQLRLYPRVGLTGRIVQILQAKASPVELEVSEMTGNKLGGVDFPIMEVVETNGTLYTISVLMEERFNTSLAGSSFPYLQAINVQFACANSHTTEQCQMKSYTMVPRQKLKSPFLIEAYTRDSILNELKKRNMQVSKLMIKEMEIQQLRAGSYPEQIQFVGFRTVPSTVPECFAYIYHNSSMTQVDFLSGLCDRKLERNSTTDPSTSGLTSFVLVSISALVFVAVVLIRQKRLNGYLMLGSGDDLNLQKNQATPSPVIEVEKSYRT